MQAEKLDGSGSLKMGGEVV